MAECYSNIAKAERLIKDPKLFVLDWITKFDLPGSPSYLHEVEIREA